MPDNQVTIIDNAAEPGHGQELTVYDNSVENFDLMSWCEAGNYY